MTSTRNMGAMSVASLLPSQGGASSSDSKASSHHHCSGWLIGDQERGERASGSEGGRGQYGTMEFSSTVRSEPEKSSDSEKCSFTAAVATAGGDAAGGGRAGVGPLSHSQYVGSQPHV